MVQPWAIFDIQLNELLDAGNADVHVRIEHEARTCLELDCPEHS